MKKPPVFTPLFSLRQGQFKTAGASSRYSNMVPSPASTYGSCYSKVPSTLHYVSTDANTRLGDFGYIERRGRWIRICNIFDLISCQAINARPIRLSRALSQYITQKQEKLLEDPVVILSPQAFSQILEPDILASYGNLVLN